MPKGGFRWAGKPPMGSQIDLSSPISRGLIFAPIMNEGAGGNAYDPAGRVSGSLATDLIWSPQPAQRPGPGLAFPSSSTASGAITYADPSGRLAGMAKLTLAAWAYPRSGGGGSNGRLVTSNDAANYSILTVSGPPTGWQFNVGGVSVSLLSTVANNLWYHVCGTYDGATMRLYVNGVQVATQAKTGAVPSSTTGVVIGNRSAGARGWDGWIDQPLIWTRDLSASEVASLSRDGWPHVSPPMRDARFFAPKSPF